MTNNIVCSSAIKNDCCLWSEKLNKFIKKYDMLEPTIFDDDSTIGVPGKELACIVMHFNFARIPQNNNHINMPVRTLTVLYKSMHYT